MTDREDDILNRFGRKRFCDRAVARGCVRSLVQSGLAFANFPTHEHGAARLIQSSFEWRVRCDAASVGSET